MPRSRQTLVEYRKYDLTGDLPLHINQGPEWRISPVPSRVLHFHNCFEIGLCLSDSGFIRFGDERIPFSAGDVICAARNVPHTIWSSPGEGSQWCFLQLEPLGLIGSAASVIPDPQQFMSMLSDCHMVLRPREHPWAAPLVRAVAEEAQQAQRGYQLCVSGLLVAFFVQLLRAYMHDEARDAHSLRIVAIAPALDYMYEHYRESFPQEQLAQICHMSPTNFRRRFHEQTGTNPLSFLHQVRILKSCSMLRASRASVADIASQVGYASLSCYNRHFLEFIGCTPTAWRNMRSDSQSTILLALNGWQRAETSEEIERRNAETEAEG